MRHLLMCLTMLFLTCSLSAQDAPIGEIAFSSNRDGDVFQIYVMNGDGSNIRQLTDGPMNASMPVWSPDGEHIAFIRGLGNESDTSGRDLLSLWIMDADGENEIEIARDEADRPYIRYPDEWLAWSPDGERLVYMRSFLDDEPVDERPHQLIRVRVDGTDSQTLIPDVVQLWDFDFLTDTTLILRGESREGDKILRYDIADNMITLFVEIGLPHEISLSPDKTQLAIHSLDDGLIWVDTATGEIHPVQRRLETNIPGKYSAFPLSLSWSADGSHIVGDLYVEAEGDTKPSLMFTVRPDGTDYAVFETEIPKLYIPMFSLSAEGRYLAYNAVDGTGTYQIAVVQTDGQKQATMITSGQAHVSPIWRPAP